MRFNYKGVKVMESKAAVIFGTIGFSIIGLYYAAGFMFLAIHRLVPESWESIGINHTIVKLVHFIINL